MVGSEVVGSEVVGSTVGDAVGPEVVGERVGDDVGLKVVGRAVGDEVGVEDVGDAVQCSSTVIRGANVRLQLNGTERSPVTARLPSNPNSVWGAVTGPGSQLPSNHWSSRGL